MNRAEFAKILGGDPHRDQQPRIISATTPEEWALSFIQAAAGQGPVFLANPDWGKTEQEQFAVLCQQRPDRWEPERGWLMIPTGGSSGQMKLARHDQSTLLAAVKGAAQHFGMSCFHSLSTLPRHHVGGLMAWMRCVLTGGTFLDVSWRRIAEGGFPNVSDQAMVVSLVPTQLLRLKQIDGGADWLRKFETVLVGGAALDRGTIRWARKEGIRLSPCYGATETGAMAAALRPHEFLAGTEGVGRTLPHMHVATGSRGELLWRGTALFCGYWPEEREEEEAWSSGDLGEIGETGAILLRGRADGLINSGGEKVNPAEVEGVLVDLLADTRLKVMGVPHKKWGEGVVLAHADDLAVDLDILWNRASDQLAKFKWPKRAVPIASWPVNTMGKVNLRRVTEIVRETLGEEFA